MWAVSQEMGQQYSERDVKMLKCELLGRLGGSVG